MKPTTVVGSMGIGLMAGTALGMALAPQKKTVQRQAKKTIRAVEDMMSTLGETLNM